MNQKSRATGRIRERLREREAKKKKSLEKLKCAADVWFSIHLTASSQPHIRNVQCHSSRIYVFTWLWLITDRFRQASLYNSQSGKFERRRGYLPLEGKWVESIASHCLILYAQNGVQIIICESNWTLTVILSIGINAMAINKNHIHPRNSASRVYFHY